MEKTSLVLCVQKESTVHLLTPLQRQTVTMEHIHGVHRSGVLRAPVDGSVQTKMELAMSNACLYVFSLLYFIKDVMCCISQSTLQPLFGCHTMPLPMMFSTNFVTNRFDKWKLNCDLINLWRAMWSRFQQPFVGEALLDDTNYGCELWFRSIKSVFQMSIFV